MRLCCLPIIATLTLALVQGASAANYKPVAIDGANVTVKTIASGFKMPLFLTAPAGDKRLFVVEKGGLIRIIKDGATLPQPFLDLSAIVATDLSAGLSTDLATGLLGLAFDPDFATNGRFYVDYTPKGQVVIAAGHAAPGADVADPAPLAPILTIEHPVDLHNGGWLGFGPDGNLYISVGDGSGTNDNTNHAQTPGDLLGKILRIDVKHGTPYTIPAGNPFAKSGGAPEVFALGLRNPWRASFDGTSLYIGDLGQDKMEELDVLSVTDQAPNLGWNRLEGTKCYLKLKCDTTGMVTPVYTFDHSLSCAITAGYVYRGKAIPALAGRYIFGDYCTGVVTTLRYADGKVSDVQGLGFNFSEANQLTSFGTDSDGEIYLMTENGVINKIVPAN